MTKDELKEAKRLAGQKGGRAYHAKRGLQTLNCKRRKEIAKLGAKARWRKP